MHDGDLRRVQFTSCLLQQRGACRQLRKRCALRRFPQENRRDDIYRLFELVTSGSHDLRVLDFVLFLQGDCSAFDGTASDQILEGDISRFIWLVKSVRMLNEWIGRLRWLGLGKRLGMSYSGSMVDMAAILSISSSGDGACFDLLERGTGFMIDGRLKKVAARACHCRGA